MGTKFRTMLAPIGMPTGDGRRFADGSISLADLPMPLEWAREREGGHNGAVSVGVVQQAQVMSVKDAVSGGWVDAELVKSLDKNQMAVWGQGEMFDDVDRETMPRLAEDVAEAMHLGSAGTLGPSVDLDSFEAIAVMEGTDEPVTWEMIEQYMDENDGAEPKIELLIQAGRVRAGTLVSIPAFMETSRPLEFIAADDAELSEDEKASAQAELEKTIALVASMAVDADLPTAERFDKPVLKQPTPITWDWESGAVYGHIAAWHSCHTGFADVCVTVPSEAPEYAAFNRFPVETSDGTIWAGRITVGGRHAGLSLSASSAMSVYDGKTTAAWVRAYADDHGIVVAGVIEDGLSGSERAAIDRRKVSGDWRETPAGLSLVEVLALSPGPRAYAEPGFPIPGTFSTHGRQTALTAALGPIPDVEERQHGSIDFAEADRLVNLALDRRAEREREAALAAQARAELTADLDKIRTHERAALAAAMNGGQ